MPCIYQCQIKQSGIHGRGIYACQDIPKGVVYWVWGDDPKVKKLIGFQQQSNVIFTREDLQKMEKENLPELIHVLHGGFLIPNTDQFVHLRDGTEFTNHSQDWNSQIIYDQVGRDYNKMTCVSRKEIKKGDQITGYYGNYLSTEKEWLNDLMVKYLPERKQIQSSVEKAGNLAKHWQI